MKWKIKMLKVLLATLIGLMMISAETSSLPSEMAPAEMWLIFDSTETGILTPWAPQKVSGVSEWKTTLSVKNNLNLWLEIVPGISNKGVILKNVDCLASHWQEKSFGKAGRRLLPPKGEVNYNVTYQKVGVPFYAEARFGGIGASLMIAKFLAALPVPGIDQLDNPVTFLEFWDKIRKIESVEKAASALKSGKIADATIKLGSLLDDKKQINILRKAFSAFKIEVSKEILANLLTISKIAKALNVLGDEITFAIQSQVGAKPVRVTFEIRTREQKRTKKKDHERKKIVLTRLRTSGEGEGILIAPGRGKQRYTVFYIDNKDFINGGTLVIEITLGKGESNASFDLFPEGVPIPTKGRPHGSVAHQYDVSRGKTVKMALRFSRGQIFQFGATGNWLSPEGSRNSYRFSARVIGGLSKHAEELEEVVFSIIKCSKSISYRAIRGDVPKEIDLSDDTKARQVLERAAHFAQEKCPKKAPYGNISVTLYQGVERFPGQWKRNYVVNARNYDADKLTWREYNNIVLRKRLAKEKARKRAEEKKAIEARKKLEAEQESHEINARRAREARQKLITMKLWKLHLNEALKCLEEAKGFKSIPKPVRKVIFQYSGFLNYITLNLPREDNPAAAKKIKTFKDAKLRLPPTHISSARQIDPNVLSILGKHGFINLEEFHLRSRYGDARHTFLSYTDKIRPYICEGNFKYKKGFSKGFKIRLASRVLKSIDYKNENKATGIYAVTFSYKFNKEFPCYEEIQKSLPGKIPSINKIYKGKAKAYLDPNDDLWKLEQLTFDR